MRGADVQQGGLFSYVLVASQIPAHYPLFAVRSRLDDAQSAIGTVFGRDNGEGGRSSPPPERLVRALVLKVLHLIHGERRTN